MSRGRRWAGSRRGLSYEQGAHGGPGRPETTGRDVLTADEKRVSPAPERNKRWVFDGRVKSLNQKVSETREFPRHFCRADRI